MTSTTHLPDVRHARAWLQNTAARLVEWADEIARTNYDAQAMRDEVATLHDIIARAPLPAMDTSTITLDEGAVTAYGEARTLIANAHTWAQGADLPFDADDDEAYTRAEQIVSERRARVAEMERSLGHALLSLLFTSQGHDGPITLSRDGEACWFWRHPRSGYHGGLIFHASHIDGERAPVGTWSVHT